MKLLVSSKITVVELMKDQWVSTKKLYEFKAYKKGGFILEFSGVQQLRKNIGGGNSIYLCEVSNIKQLKQLQKAFKRYEKL